MLYVMLYLAVYCDAAENKTAKQPWYNMRRPFCYGGIPGLHGTPGSPGVPGTAGTHGKPGSPGVPGPAGTHGKPGSPGVPGRDGREGTKGDQGSPGKTGPQGPPGPKGTSGINGKDGTKGEPGVQGPPGQKGQRGEYGTNGMPGTPGAMAYKNWKECVWKNLNDGKDSGLIKDCVFTKNFSDTALHVYWTGSLRVYKCTDCCKRWYFTFNGAECSAPQPIDGVVYMWQGNNKNLHRVRHIEGHCNNIHKGRVRVGFCVGDCEHGKPADAYTGWHSVSRIFVEEVPGPQA
ncbi:hypothetical protein ACROYT_G002641 [Oculina patagonica]